MADRYKVKLMSRALRDLDSIYKYVAETLLKVNTALNLVEEIEREIFSLEQFPLSCPKDRRLRQQRLPSAVCEESHSHFSCE